MDDTFRRLVDSWVPVVSAAVWSDTGAEQAWKGTDATVSATTNEAIRKRFISSPGWWSRIYKRPFVPAVLDRTLLLRLITGGDHGNTTATFGDCFAGALGRLQVLSANGEWKVSDDVLTEDRSVSLESYRHKVRHGKPATSTRRSAAPGSMAPGCSPSGDDDDDEEALLQYGAWCTDCTGSLDHHSVRLLSYAPINERRQLWLQYAVLLGLPYVWHKRHRDQVFWVLSALLHGFSHPRLPEIWSCIVRLWLQGGYVIRFPRAVPLVDLAARIWCHRRQARAFAPYTHEVLHWVSTQLSNASPRPSWTMVAVWFPPCVSQFLRDLRLDHSPVTGTTSTTVAVRYCLGVVMALTSLAFLAHAPNLDTMTYTWFQAWYQRLRRVVTHALEPRVREHWFLMLAQRQITAMAQTAVARELHPFVLSLYEEWQ